MVEMPYYKTSVSPDKTKGQILALIEKYGIHDYQWTYVRGKENLRFVMDAELEGQEFKVAVELQIPEIWGLYSGQKQKVPQAQRYRIFYYSLKSLLEATKFGIIRKEDVFFSYIRTQINGQVMTIKEAFLAGGGQNLLPPLK